MKTYYDVTSKLKELLDADPLVNQVTKGGIDDMLVKKFNAFGITHVMINTATPQRQGVLFNISVVSATPLDRTSETPTDLYRGADNEDDGLNSTLAVLQLLADKLRRGDVTEEGYHLQGDMTCEPFTERFEDDFVGWIGTFDLLVTSNISVCDA